MSLKDREWRGFYIDDLFYIKSGKRLTKENMVEGNVPFIGSVDSNNGITNYVSNINKSLDSNVLGINYNGSVCEVFYHPYQCIFSDDVKHLSLKNIQGNKYIYLFFASIIYKQKIKYTYGYKFNENRMKRQMIIVPVNENNQPDYEYMDKYTRNQYNIKKNKYEEHVEMIASELKYKKILPLENKEWAEFFITQLFPLIQRGKRLTKANQIKGKIPYISSTSLNNGIDNYIANNKNVRIFKNCLTIANSGSVGVSFYQPFKFVASDHITHLKNDNMNKYIYLFIATLTNRFSEKYNFNREINDKRISREKIMLPVDKNGEPDYAYMEQYIKNIMINKYNKYMKYSNKEERRID